MNDANDASDANDANDDHNGRIRDGTRFAIAGYILFCTTFSWMNMSCAERSCLRMCVVFCRGLFQLCSADVRLRSNRQNSLVFRPLKPNGN